MVVNLLFFSNEDKARKMEKIVYEMIEESSLAFEQNDNKVVRRMIRILNLFDKEYDIFLHLL